MNSAPPARSGDWHPLNPSALYGCRPKQSASPGRVCSREKKKDFSEEQFAFAFSSTAESCCSNTPPGSDLPPLKRRHFQRENLW